jgi:hypothetical protein
MDALGILHDDTWDAGRGGRYCVGSVGGFSLVGSIVVVKVWLVYNHEVRVGFCLISLLRTL